MGFPVPELALRRLPLLLVALAPLAHADTGHDLRVAARSGDLAEVRRLVEAGADVDAADSWGTTPLLLAAKQQQVDVVRYLLAKAADPDARERFFGSTVLEQALDDGAPDYEVARMLLEAGADDRAAALDTAFGEGRLELARAATASGPVLESEAK
ncbi:MAG TPA: ankyrin repeat domain-containing protein, partial [Candidatus Polarisedimenticolaceae bacterium]|nr:ankyrin repeat domain-containing protein [Candidatus Polarisedimenticolaceae bacterium]